MNRKIWIVIAAVAAALVVLAIVAAPAFIDVNHYRPQIQAKLSEQLGRPVSLGKMRLTLIPLRFRVDQAVIGEAPEFQSGRPFAQAQELYVRPKLLPLLQHEIEISKVELIEPRVEFVRNPAGVWNFTTLGRRDEPSGRSLSIDDLEIRNGQVAVTDLQQNKARSVYDHINLALRDFAPDASFSINGTIGVPGPGSEVLEFHGEAGPIASGEILRTPFNGKLRLEQVSLSGLQQALKMKALNDSDGLLTGDIQIHSKDGEFTSSGNLRADNPRVRGVAAGYPIAVDYDISGDLARRSYNIRKGKLHLGKTPVSVTGSVNATATPALVDVQLNTSEASLGEAARLAAALGLAFNRSTQINGVLNADIHARGPIDKPQMQGQASARNVRITGGTLKQPVGIDVIQLSLSPMEIQSNDFAAKTGSTTLRAQFTIDRYASQSPAVHAKITAPDAQVAELLDIARAYGVSSVDGLTGTGAAKLNLTVTGLMKQPEQLQYSGTGALRDGTFNLSSLAKPLVVKTADIRFTGNSAVLNNLEAVIGNTTARGTFSIQNPEAPAPRVEFSISADKVDVRDWENLAKPLQDGAPGGKRAGLIERVAGSGRMSINTVVYDEMTLQNVQTAVRLNQGVITMDPLTAGLYGGQSVGSVILDLRRRPVAYTANLKLQNVDANSLTSAISPLHDAVYGSLAANPDVTFTGVGAPNTIAHTLNGRVSIDLSNGAIGHMDLLHQLAAIGQFLTTGQPAQPATKVGQLTGTFDITDGVAKTNDLKAVMDSGSFAGAGSIDLAQETLNMHVTAVLSKAYSQGVGGTAIGGFLNTAVANQNGELVIPVIITGSFQHPQFTPDIAAVAQMKLRQLTPSANNPGQFAVGILGQILGGKGAPPVVEEKPKPQQTEPPPQQPKQPPAPSLPDILNRIFKNHQ